MLKKLKYVTGGTLMLAAGIMLGNGNGIIGNSASSYVVYADSEVTSDDGAWTFDTSGEITSYLGNDDVITVPDALTYDGVSYPITMVDYSVFRYNTKIKQINFSASTNMNGVRGFEGCNSLREVNVPTSNPYFASVGGVLYTKDEDGNPYQLVTIPAETDITTLTIPDSVEKVNYMGINPNNTIQSLYIGSSLTQNTILSKIGNFKALKSINVSNENTMYKAQNGVLYNKDMTTIMCYPCKKQNESFTFPQTVNDMNTNTFYDSTPSLKNITFTNYLGKDTNNSCKFDKLQLTSLNGCTTITQYDNLSSNTKKYIGHILKKIQEQPIVVSLCNQELDRALATYTNDSMTIYEKMYAMNTYVCNKVHYAPYDADSPELERDQYHCIPDIFLTDEAVCEGYTLGYSLILDRLGIENRCAHTLSVGKTSHVFNMVKLNDIWLSIDVTWNDDVYNPNQYFLVTYDEMQKSTEIDNFHVVKDFYKVERFNSYDTHYITYANTLPDYNPLIGDINLDGQLDRSDLQLMANEIHSFTRSEENGGTYYNVKADMDRDGNINSTDYDLLYAKVYR